MAKRAQDTEIEAGDLVLVVASPDAHWLGMVGVFDQAWHNDGIVKFVVIDPEHDEEFTYATEIKLYKKAA